VVVLALFVVCIGEVQMQTSSDFPLAVGNFAIHKFLPLIVGENAPSFPVRAKVIRYSSSLHLVKISPRSFDNSPAS
jgi:hypothetical protein